MQLITTRADLALAVIVPARSEAGCLGGRVYGFRSNLGEENLGIKRMFV